MKTYTDADITVMRNKLRPLQASTEAIINEAIDDEIDTNYDLIMKDSQTMIDAVRPLYLFAKDLAPTSKSWHIMTRVGDLLYFGAIGLLYQYQLMSNFPDKKPATQNAVTDLNESLQWFERSKAFFPGDNKFENAERKAIDKAIKEAKKLKKEYEEKPAVSVSAAAAVAGAPDSKHSNSSTAAAAGALDSKHSNSSTAAAAQDSKQGKHSNSAAAAGALDSKQGKEGTSSSGYITEQLQPSLSAAELVKLRQRNKRRKLEAPGIGGETASVATPHLPAAAAAAAAGEAPEGDAKIDPPVFPKLTITIPVDGKSEGALSPTQIPKTPSPGGNAPSHKRKSPGSPQAVTQPLDASGKPIIRKGRTLIARDAGLTLWCDRLGDFESGTQSDDEYATQVLASGASLTGK